MIAITHEPEKNRYLATSDGQTMGSIDYLLDGNRMTVTHTNTNPEAQGQGIAGKLTKFVLDDAREQNLTVVPQCPYTASYFEKHPEYADLL